MYKPCLHKTQDMSEAINGAAIIRLVNNLYLEQKTLIRAALQFKSQLII